LGRARVAGYEIHMGVSTGPALERPFAHLGSGADGAVGEDGNIIGTYMHGVFDEREACDTLLAWAGLARAQSPDYRVLREQHIDRLADAVEAHVDLERVMAILGPAPALSA
jgi:adenosylcobyric acid synthase